MPRWSARTRRSKARPGLASKASGFTRCWRSSTTVTEYRRAAGGDAAPGAGQRQQRRRSDRGARRRAGQLPEPLRSGRWCAEIPVGSAGVAVARPRLGLGLLGGERSANLCSTHWRRARASLAGSTRYRRPTPRQRPSRRADPVDADHLDRLAAGDANHRPPRASPPWRPVAHHRRRRLADHRVRHQHRRWEGSPSWRCGTDCAHGPKTASADSRTPG